MLQTRGLLLDAGRGIRIRRLAPDDAEATIDIACRAFDSEGVGATLRHMLEVYFSSGMWNTPLESQSGSLVSLTYYALVEQIDGAGRMVGLSGLYRRAWDHPDDGNYWLGWFAVDPRQQRSGLGTLLLRGTASICAAKGGRRLCIETAPGLESALRLYRAEGFRDVNAIPSYWSPGADLAIAYRDLDPAEKNRFGPIAVEEL